MSSYSALLTLPPAFLIIDGTILIRLVKVELIVKVEFEQKFEEVKYLVMQL